MEWLVHWVVLIAFTALTGSVVVPVLVMRSPAAHPLLEATFGAYRRWLSIWITMSAGASVLFLLAMWPVFEDGRVVWLTAARLGLLGILAVHVWRRHEVNGWLIAPALALLLTQSLLSRSAARTDWLPYTLNDWFHMTLTASWLGGVAVLACILIPAVINNRALLGALSHIVDRFSLLAIFCVAGLGVSGLIQSGAFLRDLSDLIETDFGRALSVKLAGSMVLIGFGALHQQVIAPRLRLWRLRAGQAEAQATTLRFRFSLYAEVITSLIVLLFVAAMKSSH
ncbi:MAG: CopD family protein [Anaerolineae bacterium]|nr:CopD family protein [Thermoflexales bacterium]MDW8406651.1 CopD family protein [Anaerolineae bacterium]